MVLKTLRRKLKGLTGDGEDRGVSPVIGVILMVAITVILAAVIGAFVLGLSPGGEVAPSAQLSFSNADADGEVRISHTGGDTLDLTGFTMLVGGTAVDNLPDEDLSPGEYVEVDTDSTGTVEIALRHDSSGSVVAQATIDVGST